MVVMGMVSAIGMEENWMNFHAVVIQVSWMIIRLECPSYKQGFPIFILAGINVFLWKYFGHIWRGEKRVQIWHFWGT